MDKRFDPYHRWLAIPPEEQPPDAYRLLGVHPLEADADVIGNAADRQMAHVRSQASGPHKQHCQQILNELAKARQCLLDSQRKAEYDQSLDQQSAPPPLEVALQDLPPVVPHLESTVVPPAPVFEGAPLGSGGTIVKNSGLQLGTPRSPWKNRKSAKDKLAKIGIIGHIVAPVLGLALGYLLLHAFVLNRESSFFGDDLPTASSTDANHGASATSPGAKPPPNFGPDMNGVLPYVKERESDPFQEPERPQPDFSPLPEDLAIGPPESDVEIEPVLNPFHRLPEHLKIPPLDTLDPMALANVDVTPNESLQLTLVGPPVADRSELTFGLGERRAAGEGTTWQVLMVRTSDEAGGAAKTLEIGEMRFAKDALSFQWGPNANRVPSSQLRNCLLELQVGKDRKVLALRKPIFMPPLSLRLKKDTDDRHSLTLTDPPDEKLIYIEITHSSVILPQHRFEPDSRVVANGIPLKIHFSKPRDAEFRIKADLRGEELSIEIDGVYTLDNRQYPLTEDRVNKQLRSLQKQYSEGHQELKQLKSAVRSLEQRIEALRSMIIPGSTAHDRAVAERKRNLELSRLYKQRTKNAKRRKTLEKKLPRVKVALKQLPEVIKLGNSLQTNAKLHYRLFVAWDYYEVLLIASDDYAPAAGERPADLGDAETEAIRQSKARLHADWADPHGRPADLGDAETEAFRQAQARLHADPADPQAHFQVGHHYCFRENNWKKGLAYLRLSDDEALAAAAQLDVDLDDAPDADAQVAVADSWYELAMQDETRRDFLVRAAHWYRSALPQLGGLKKLKVQKRLEKIDNVDPNPMNRESFVPQLPTLTGAQPRELAAALDQVKGSLASRDLAAAQRSMDRAKAIAAVGAPGEHSGRVYRMSLLCDYVGEFWDAVRSGMPAIDGKDFNVGDVMIHVNEANEQGIRYRRTGRSYEHTFFEMPAGLVRAIGEHWLDDTHESRIFVGAFMAVDPAYGVEKAREQWTAALRGGVPVAELIPILDEL